MRKLLTPSRIEAGVLGAEPVAFDVSDLVLSRLPELGDRSRDVRVACPPGVVAYADADHLWQILANYIENAFKCGTPPSTVGDGARRLGRAAGVRLGRAVPDEFGSPPVRALQPWPGGAAAGGGAGSPGSRSCAASAEAGGGEAWYEPVSPPEPASASGYRAAPPSPEAPRKSRTTPSGLSGAAADGGTPIWADPMTPLRSPRHRER